jgi:hypothetical protein
MRVAALRCSPRGGACSPPNRWRLLYVSDILQVNLPSSPLHLLKRVSASHENSPDSPDSPSSVPPPLIGCPRLAALCPCTHTGVLLVQLPTQRPVRCRCRCPPKVPEARVDTAPSPEGMKPSALASFSSYHENTDIEARPNGVGLAKLRVEELPRELNRQTHATGRGRLTSFSCNLPCCVRGAK